MTGALQDPFAVNVSGYFLGLLLLLLSPAAVVGLVDDLLVGIAIQEEEASLRIGPISSKGLET